jgi:hypothetical protein
MCDDMNKGISVILYVLFSVETDHETASGGLTVAAWQAAEAEALCTTHCGFPAYQVMHLH